MCSSDLHLVFDGELETRFRVNLFKQRGRLSLVARRVSTSIPDFEGLGLPPVMAEIASYDQGIVILAGVTGSGKSTTIASMLNYVNQRERCCIVTIEDPIEFTFTDDKSMIHQREVGIDVLDWDIAMKHAVRQDPDIILVGEMRDKDTFHAAMHAAETGHLVMSTLHTLDAVETVNRIIGMFSPHQQAQIRLALAAVLKGVVSQRLVPRADGKGMVPALEIMVNTERVREMIEDPMRTREIKDAISEGLHPYGMVSFDQSLASLVKQRLVTYEEAVKHSTSPSDFALLFRGVSGSAERAWTPSEKGATSHDEFDIEHFEK